MGESGFTHKAAEIYKDLKTLVKISGKDGRKTGQAEIKAAIANADPKGIPKKNGYPVSMMILHNQYRYRGNALSKLVPDLGAIAVEGTVGLPDSLMKELKVKAGEQVRIISDYGAMDSMVRSIPELKSQTACFLPNGNLPSGILDEVYSGNSVINVKIEKA